MSSITGLTTATETYVASYNSKTAVNTDSAKESEAKKETAAESGAVYDKTESSGSDQKATYSVHKMSAEERQALVQQLKQDQENRQSQLLDIVNKMITGQATAFSQTNEDFWKFLAKGDYTVDEETKAQAQADIAEDGYYGVNNTAQRLFDFASALAGDDEEQMQKMQEAVKKGFEQAEKLWGDKLPDISYKTKDAVDKMFEDYYNSKKTITEDAQ